MTASNGSLFRVTGTLCGEFTGDRWIPFTKASDVVLWCFLWSAPEQTVEQTIKTTVIWDAIVPIMASLQCFTHGYSSGFASSESAQFYDCTNKSTLTQNTRRNSCEWFFNCLQSAIRHKIENIVMQYSESITIYFMVHFLLELKHRHAVNSCALAAQKI